MNESSHHTTDEHEKTPRLMQTFQSHNFWHVSNILENLGLATQPTQSFYARALRRWTSQAARRLVAEMVFRRNDPPSRIPAAPCSGSVAPCSGLRAVTSRLKLEPSNLESMRKAYGSPWILYTEQAGCSASELGQTRQTMGYQRARGKLYRPDT